MPRGWNVRRSLATMVVGTVLSIVIALLGARVDFESHEVGRSEFSSCFQSLLWTRFESDNIEDPVDLALRLNVLPSLAYQTAQLHPHLIDFVAFPSSDGRLQLVHSGWPWRSLEGWQAIVPRSSGMVEDLLEKAARDHLPPPRSLGYWRPEMITLSSAVLCELPFRKSAPTFVPFAPRWWALIGNALVFTLLLGLAMETMTCFRHRHRLLHGLCPYCRYDLRLTPPETPCPECGRHITVS